MVDALLQVPLTVVKPRDLIADGAFRHEIEALHRLGPRVIGELVVELVRSHGPEVRARMVMFAALDPEALAALDARRWPALPIYRVAP